MALFIEIELSGSAASSPEIGRKLAEVCPVGIFEAKEPGAPARIVERQLDECTLCELCLAVAPAGEVRVLKLYDDRKPLVRSA
jgi:NAD-dependent dihydropyrimidine dehydrogenase PreA subunit